MALWELLEGGFKVIYRKCYLVWSLVQSRYIVRGSELLTLKTEVETKA